MNELLIPFGFDLAGNIVEPEQAVSGRNCRCFCPGCKAPLLARHPKQARRHFAHDSQHPDAIPNNHCELSPYVALMMMIRHIAKSFQGSGIWCPEHEISIEHECCYHHETIQVAKAGTLRIAECEKDHPTCDLVLMVDDTSFLLIDFVHPQKIPNETPSLADPGLIGLLQIDCTNFPAFLGLHAKTDLSYSQIVKKFVLETQDKYWVHHRLSRAKESEAFLMHDCPPLEHFTPPSEKNANQRRVFVEPAITDIQYECAICRSLATFKSNQEPFCKLCNMTLTMRVKSGG